MEQDLRAIKMVDGYLYRVNEDGTLELAKEETDQLIEEKIDNEKIEDIKANHDCHASPESGC
jgi:hypothetical protein